MLLLACGLFLSLCVIVKRSVFFKVLFKGAFSLLCYVSVLIFIVVTFSSAFRKSLNKKA